MSRRCSSSRAWTVLREPAPLVPEVRTCHRRQSTPRPPRAQRPLAPRRDGDRHPAETHLALACRRQRRRGPGLSRSKTASCQSSAKVDEDAARDAGLCTKPGGCRQASVLRVSLPSHGPCGRARPRPEGRRQGPRIRINRFAGATPNCKGSPHPARRKVPSPSTSATYNTFYHRRHPLKRPMFKDLRTASFEVWQGANVAA